MTTNANFDYYEENWQTISSAPTAFCNEQDSLTEDQLKELTALKEETTATPQLSIRTQNFLNSINTEINYRQKPDRPQPAALKAAIEGYKKGSMSCTEQLYIWYRPLILALAYRYSIRTNLGEDAENIAWEKFYYFLKEYKGNDYQRLPGLIKKRLISRLADVAQSRLYYDPRLEYSDTIENFDSSYDPWSQYIYNIHLKYALDKLKPLQKKVIYCIYFEDKSALATAKLLNKKYHIVHYAHKLSLAALRNYYLKHKLIEE